MTPEQREQELQKCWDAVGERYHFSFNAFKEHADADDSMCWRAWSARAEMAYADAEKADAEIMQLKVQISAFRNELGNAKAALTKSVNRNIELAGRCNKTPATDTRRAELVKLVCACISQQAVRPFATALEIQQMIDKAMEGK
jgi:hypothetical protein